MGNSPACLSSSEHDHCSTRDLHQQEDAGLLTRAASRSSASADDHFYKPLLKPCIRYNHNQDKGKPHDVMQAGCTPRVAPAPDAHHRLPTGGNVKVVKKVRFVDEAALIDSTSNKEINPMVSAYANEGESEELIHKKKKHESSKCMNPSTHILIDQSSSLVGKQSSIVRMKVVISRRELIELLKTKEKQSPNDALMERILNPLLSSPNKMSQTLNVQPYIGIPDPWRPSLQQISEAHLPHIY